MGRPTPLMVEGGGLTGVSPQYAVCAILFDFPIGPAGVSCNLVDKTPPCVLWHVM